MDQPSSEAQIRLLFFAGTFAVMFLLETVLPRRVRVENRTRRTVNNLLLAILNSMILRAIPLLSAVGAASLATRYKWGILNHVELPFAFEVAVSVVVLDLVIYWQHVASHRFAVLWRFHQVHHADHDLDASSGFRFHPVEIVFSMIIKCFVVVALGAPPEGVVTFEIVLSSCAIFNHSNLAIPSRLDRAVRFLVVTPDMHRIHHSVIREETDSNYGFSVPLWDRMFRTYREDPQEGHERIKLGLPEYPSAKQTVPLIVMLRMPFRRESSEE